MSKLFSNQTRCLLSSSNFTKSKYISTSASMSSSDIGSGSGRGGGSGGSVREAGGAMGRREAAQEEAYFRKKNAEMKDKLKDHLSAEIKKHQDAIKANKKLIDDIEKEKA